MARENQDLQIALIISVMLTIILGVATFLCYRKYTDSEKSLLAAHADAAKKQQDADKAKSDANQLKRYLGVAESENIDEISNQFNDDMKKYGGAYAQEVQFYRPLVEKLFLTIQDKDKDLVATKDENQQLKGKFEQREKTKDDQLKEFADMVIRITKDVKDRSENYQKETDRLKDALQTAQKNEEASKKSSEASSSEAKARLDEETAQHKKTRDIAKALREENAGLVSTTMDNPDGEISWVNQRNGTVWINKGRADSLNALTTFSVYPADITNLGKSAKKASIEVTQILGDHLSEARILDDKIIDPVMPGDKIHTPVWSPGDKRHFALAGFMDINGDGKNNMQLLHNLIVMSGGVVDCEVDEKGKQVGEISLQTRYIVLGDNPGEKGEPNSVEAYSKIRGDAQNLGIQKISLSDLLDRMGYKPQAHVVTFGPGANPKDFKPKPEGGVNRVSTGSVSDLYKPRQPPRSGTGGAY